MGGKAVGLLEVRREQARLLEGWVRNLADCGREDEALHVCVDRAMPAARSSGMATEELAALLERLGLLWLVLAPHCAAAHAALAEARLGLYEADVHADASPGSTGEGLLRLANAGFERSFELEGKP